jgi:ParB family chromosome partitioning protein
MKLDFIPLDKLTVSKANMRYGKRPPDVSDILPTVRKRGVIQPVIVRTNCAPDGFEIVAGSRRFHAAKIVADERIAAGEPPEPMPCAILDDADDAAAVEASLIENIARLDADEVTQWETFTRLVKEGRTVDEIAATFGLPDLTIKRVLALGNLLPRIRALYAAEEIDRTTVRHLTMASKSQQRAWLALADDPDGYLPTGHQLKAWLFGGQSISAAYALFDVEVSGLATVADLFGEERYFADADAFWGAQSAAIEARRAAFVEAGWADAIVVPQGEHFASWEYEKAGKRKGGRVYFDVRQNGEVVVHEGYVSRREAARLARGDSGGGSEFKPKRPEITSTMQTYIDLHRHAAVRADLSAQPQVALRLMVAHAITGSPLWSVKPEPQTARSDAVAESVENSSAEAAFDAKRRAVLGLLGFGEDEPTVTGGNADPYGLTGLFYRLLDLPDALVMEVIAIVMGETLASGSAAVEAVGLQLGTDMTRHWQADDAFFELLRDKEVTNRLVAEVAGDAVASANAGEKVKSQKAIIRDCLGGTNGRAEVAAWVPKWMAFPPAAYTARGGVGTVTANAVATASAADAEGGDEPDPGAPPAALGAPDTEDDGVIAPEDEPHEDRLAA